MGRNNFQIQSSALQGYESLVTELGGDVSTLLSNLGVQSLGQNQQRISSKVMGQLLDHSAKVLQQPDFGMRLGASQDFNALGDLGDLLKHSDTFERALKIGSSMLTYHSQGEIWYHKAYKNLGYLYWQDLTEQVQEHRQFKELAFAICMGLIRSALGNVTQDFRIEFSHQQTSSLASYQQYLKVPVMFNCERDAVVFPSKYLKQNLRLANDTIFLQKQKLVNQQMQINPASIVEKVSALIQQNLHSGAPTLEFIANVLDINLRSLQRRLQEAGINYKGLMLATRMTVAKRYLVCSDLDITLVAQLSGYSELANFSRAFKQYVGLTPLKWRQSQ